jgi:hypothetical protein
MPVSCWCDFVAPTTDEGSKKLAGLPAATQNTRIIKIESSTKEYKKIGA